MRNCRLPDALLPINALVSTLPEMDTPILNALILAKFDAFCLLVEVLPTKGFFINYTTRGMSVFGRGEGDGEAQSCLSQTFRRCEIWRCLVVQTSGERCGRIGSRLRAGILAYGRI